jgi:hypothetical protein
MSVAYNENIYEMHTEEFSGFVMGKLNTPTTVHEMYQPGCLENNIFTHTDSRMASRGF